MSLNSRGHHPSKTFLIGKGGKDWTANILDMAGDCVSA